MKLFGMGYSSDNAGDGPQGCDDTGKEVRLTARRKRCVFSCIVCLIFHRGLENATEDLDFQAVYEPSRLDFPMRTVYEPSLRVEDCLERKEVHSFLCFGGRLNCGVFRAKRLPRPECLSKWKIAWNKKRYIYF